MHCTILSPGGAKRKRRSPSGGTFACAVMEKMPPAAAARWPHGDSLDDGRLLPAKPDWAVAFANDWTPGEGALPACRRSKP
ncbi:hypothetical protein [Sphingobium sp.]|uniref:hypothetical protein n=1 Tax=Sphingobium sp. TaxID=1912891 RepID=UPI0028BD2439|nr:hypothetical protein [Sphingobium sp.]